MTYKDFCQLASERFSARDFLNKPIEQNVLESILHTASLAPSWSNTRAYALAIAQGSKKDNIVKAYLDKCNAMLKAKDKSLSESERAQFAQESAPNGDVPSCKAVPRRFKTAKR